MTNLIMNGTTKNKFKGVVVDVQTSSPQGFASMSKQSCAATAIQTILRKKPTLAEDMTSESSVAH